MNDRAVRGPLYAVALTRDGARLASRLARAFPGCRALAPARYARGLESVEAFEGPVARRIRELWPGAGGFFLVMAAGIAVRSVAPLLADKARDPAVVVLDPAGEFAVPILSGHLGGANDLAREVGRRLGATPVITTATDVAGRPAIEVWARDHGLRVESREGVVRINAAWANEEPVAAYVDPALEAGPLTASLVPHLELLTENEREARAFRGALLAVTHRQGVDLQAALVLRPACLALGVGCRRGADPDEVEAGVRQALADAELSALAVEVVASVDAKKDEPALRSLASSLGAPFETYSAQELAQVRVPSPSARVREAVGTPSVSEAAALAARGGRLILPKVKGSSWTLAVALRRLRSWEVGRPVSLNLEPRPTLFVVGIGPGGRSHMTQRALEALDAAQVVVGYTRYIEMLGGLVDGKEVISTGMTREVERCRRAVEAALGGRRVAVVSTGDPGVYGMAGLVLELLAVEDPEGQVPVEVVPGVSAVHAAASLLGAPLMTDFAVVSLSDLLTPWETIRARLAAVAAADLVVALYNPKSRKRKRHLEEACAILARHRSPETPAGVVRHALRAGQSVELTTLGDVPGCQVDMMSVVLVGNSTTRRLRQWIVTPRGYSIGGEDKSDRK